MQFNFSPDETFFSYSGNSTSLLDIKALDNDTAGIHLLPIFANESFPNVLEDIALGIKTTEYNSITNNSITFSYFE